MSGLHLIFSTLVLMSMPAMPMADNWVCVEDEDSKRRGYLSDINIKIPQDSYVHGHYKSVESDLICKVLFEVESQSFEGWLSGLGIAINEFKPERQYLFGDNNDWWNPQEVDQMPMVQVVGQSGMVLNIGYQKLKDDAVKVFVLYYDL